MYRKIAILAVNLVVSLFHVFNVQVLHINTQIFKLAQKSNQRDATRKFKRRT